MQTMNIMMMMLRSLTAALILAGQIESNEDDKLSTISGPGIEESGCTGEDSVCDSNARKQERSAPKSDDALKKGEPVNNSARIKTTPANSIKNLKIAAHSGNYSVALNQCVLFTNDGRRANKHLIACVKTNGDNELHLKCPQVRLSSKEYIRINSSSKNESINSPIEMKNIGIEVNFIYKREGLTSSDCVGVFVCYICSKPKSDLTSTPVISSSSSTSSSSTTTSSTSTSSTATSISTSSSPGPKQRCEKTPEYFEILTNSLGGKGSFECLNFSAGFCNLFRQINNTECIYHFWRCLKTRGNSCKLWLCVDFSTWRFDVWSNETTHASIFTKSLSEIQENLCTTIQQPKKKSNIKSDLYKSISSVSPCLTQPFDNFTTNVQNCSDPDCPLFEVISLNSKICILHICQNTTNISNLIFYFWTCIEPKPRQTEQSLFCDTWQCVDYTRWLLVTWKCTSILNSDSACAADSWEAFPHEYSLT